MQHSHSLLSKPAILEQLGKGIFIDPFNIDQLKTCSYDVRLGERYYRRCVCGSGKIFNPYDPKAIRDHFEGPFRANLAREIPGYDDSSPDWINIESNDRVILLAPNELILGHTEEFVGGTRSPTDGRCFTAEMKARSSIGRVGFEVCRCAGWGDIGYTNRWTMEIKNDDPLSTPLVVGTRIAQMKFYEVDPVDWEDLYGCDTSRDHYQSGLNHDAMKTAWRPEMLLPKLTKD